MQKKFALNNLTNRQKTSKATIIASRKLFQLITVL